MANDKFVGIWSKINALDKDLAQKIVNASVSMGVSPDDLVFWNMICKEIQDLKHQSARDFLSLLAKDMNADQIIEGAGSCRGMGGCRGMSSCRGMGGCAMNSGDYDTIGKDSGVDAHGIFLGSGAEDLIVLCTMYDLTPLDLALCWVQCPYVSAFSAKDIRQLKELVNKINVEIKRMPIPPRPQGEVARTTAKSHVKNASVTAGKKTSKAKRSPARTRK